MITIEEMTNNNVVGETVIIQNLLILFLVALILLTVVDPALAAAKKKKSKTDLEVEKALTPIVEVITPLSQKGAARGLFSPDDVAKAMDAKLKLLDLIHDYPTNQLLAKPAYEAGRLFRCREMYDDAYDFYNYVQTNFPTSPYASMSRVEIQRMKQQLGERYFSDSATNPQTPTSSTP